MAVAYAPGTLKPDPGAVAQAALDVVAEHDMNLACKPGGGESGGENMAFANAPGTLGLKPGAVAQAALGVIAEYDLLSGCKLGGGESGGATVAMAYAPDASALIAISSVRLRAALCCLALSCLAALLKFVAFHVQWNELK